MFDRPLTPERTGLYASIRSCTAHWVSETEIETSHPDCTVEALADDKFRITDRSWVIVTDADTGRVNSIRDNDCQTSFSYSADGLPESVIDSSDCPGAAQASFTYDPNNHLLRIDMDRVDDSDVDKFWYEIPSPIPRDASYNIAYLLQNSLNSTVDLLLDAWQVTWDYDHSQIAVLTQGDDYQYKTQEIEYDEFGNPKVIRWFNRAGQVEEELKYFYERNTRPRSNLGLIAYSAQIVFLYDFTIVD